MMSAVLVALTMLTYEGQPVFQPDTTPYPRYTVYAPVPAYGGGYEIVPTPREATVEIAGKVVHPGEYQFYPGMTVSDVVGYAGSFMNQADYEDIRIIRQEPDGEVTYSLSWHIHWQRLVLLRPGDVVVVPDRSLFTY